MRLKTIMVIVAIVPGLLAAGAAQNVEPRPPLGAFGESEYRLGPDDVIEVFVWKEPELSTTVVVRPDGNVSLPLIGELPANGKTSVQLQREITLKLKELVSEPVVNVMVKEVNSAKVSVLGEVRNPGMYKIRDRATLLDAVALAGGFTEYAKRDKVTVIRSTADGRSERYNLDLDKLIKKSKGDLFYVLPYDKIWVQ
jgi:polysaccharide export outer membrane protein